jgi:hypothetical protein
VHTEVKVLEAGRQRGSEESCSKEKEQSMLLWRKRSIPLAMGMMLAIALVILAWTMTRPAQASGNVESLNDTAALTDQVFNPCTGDLVTYEGTIHLVRTVTYDSAGGTHVIDHLNIHALGVDERGAKYAVSQVGNSSGTAVGDSTSSVFTVLILFHMQRQGETDTPDDFTLTAVVHVTTNANEITVTEFEMRNEQCTPASASPNASASSGAATAEATASAQ